MQPTCAADAEAYREQVHAFPAGRSQVRRSSLGEMVLGLPKEPRPA